MQKPDNAVAGILCPTLFHQPRRPFRVGRADDLSFCIRYNKVFCYGFLPLCNRLFNFLYGLRFLLWVSSPAVRICGQRLFVMGASPSAVLL